MPYSVAPAIQAFCKHITERVGGLCLANVLIRKSLPQSLIRISGKELSNREPVAGGKQVNSVEGYASACDENEPLAKFAS